MQHWSVQDILEATQGRLVGVSGVGECTGISIDTRTLKEGEVYVAIRGLRFDGHAFLQQAVDSGARCLVVSDLSAVEPFIGSLPVVLVFDTTRALGDCAHFHRRRLNKKVIAITGSCGKTTTKDIIAHILAGEGPVLKSQGTQNNHIGVPLTLLRLEPAHRYAVVELGSNHPGEIAYLASIAEPDIALVTNVGPAHLEHFGSLMKVLEEKLSLLQYLAADGVAILPGDQLDVCLEAAHYLSSGMRRITFGSQERCDIRMEHLVCNDSGMVLQLDNDLGNWTLPLLGYHNAENALAAIACAWVLGVPAERMKERLLTCPTPPMRSELLQLGGFQVLNDCYNANPLSCARALELLRDMQVRRRIAILGDMLELGAFASSAHRAIGRMAARMGADLIIAVGEHADEIVLGVCEDGQRPVYKCECAEQARTYLESILTSGDGVLIKGSRLLGLEIITDHLKTRHPVQTSCSALTLS